MTIQLKHPISITYHRAPTPKDYVATTNHICFILAQKPIVTVTTYYRYHLHVNHASPHTTLRWPSHSRGEILTEMQLNMAKTCGPRIRWYCFVIGSTTELVRNTHCRCLTQAGRHQNHVQMIFGFLSEILAFACPKPRLGFTSRLANAYKVTRSNLGVSLLHTALELRGIFRSPSQVIICNSKYFFFHLFNPFNYEFL